MDGGSVSGSRPAVPTGELPAGELPVGVLPVGVLPWVGVSAAVGRDLRLREVASFRRGGGEKRLPFFGVVLVVGRSSLDFSIIMSNFAPCFLKERYA